MSRMCSFLLLTAGIAFAQPAAKPAISRVAGAADYGSEIPHGSIFSVFGSSLAPPASNPNGVKVRVWAGYQMNELLAEAPLLYVSASQINAVLPPAVPAGIRVVTVVAGELESAPAAMTVTEGRFAPFTQSGTGAGPAVIQQYDDAGAPRLNGFTRPAVPRAVMTLWGTGLGVLRSDVTVIVAGLPVAPSYAGPAPGLPGVDQINFTLPADVPLRCLVPLLVRTGEAASGVVTLAASADGRLCESEFGLSGAALAALDNGGVVRGAVLSVTSTTLRSTGAVNRQAEAWAAEYDAAALSRLAIVDLLPLANPGGLCFRRTYSYRLHQPQPLLEEGIYGLRRIAARLSGSCINQAGWAAEVVQIPGCTSPFWFSGSLAPPPARFYVTGNLPAARPANIVRILGVDTSGEQVHVSWTAAPSDPSDRVAVTAGSSFSYKAGALIPTTDVSEVTCQLAADKISTRFRAFTYFVKNPVSVALTGVKYQLFPPGDSMLDFVLVRSRTSTSDVVPLN